MKSANKWGVSGPKYQTSVLKSNFQSFKTSSTSEIIKKSLLGHNKTHPKKPQKMRQLTYR